MSVVSAFHFVACVAVCLIYCVAFSQTGRTALHFAVETRILKDNSEIVLLLLAHPGIDVTLTTSVSSVHLLSSLMLLMLYYIAIFHDAERRDGADPRRW